MVVADAMEVRQVIDMVIVIEWAEADLWVISAKWYKSRRKRMFL